MNLAGIYGVSFEGSKGLAWRIVVHPEDEARVMDEWLATVAMEATETEFRMRRADGEYRWFVVIRCRCATNWTDRKVVFVGHDIDDRKTG